MNFEIKLPHYVQVGLAAAIVALTWVMRAKQPDIDATIPTTITLGVVVKLVVGLFSSSVSGPTNILAGQRAANAAKIAAMVLMLGMFGATQTACGSTR